MDLLEAVESGDEAGVKRCLDDGADALFADDEGFTCLHMAAQEGYDAIAMMLLRKGALVDATDDSGVQDAALPLDIAFFEQWELDGGPDGGISTFTYSK